jgi:hypothetical protein
LLASRTMVIYASVYTVVIGGVDAHADTHHAAALDARGALLASRQFAATSAGYEQLYEWLSGLGRVKVRKTLRARLAICRRFRSADASTPVHAAKLALKTIADRVSALDREIAVLDAQLEQLVATAAPRTTGLLGISTGHAGQFLVTAGQNIDRLGKGESSFAALCGASPIKASSGKTNRHRLNPGGDRQANRALHLVAVFRLGCCPRT